MRFSGLEDPSGVNAVLMTLKRNLFAYAAGQSVASEGEAAASVYFVLDGWIALSKTLEDGERQIIDLVLPGDIATVVCADGTTACNEVKALTDSVVAALRHADWEALQRESPHLRFLTEHLAAAAQARLGERMLRLGKASAPTRIAYALLELCVRLRSVTRAQTDTFHLPMTQQYIGEFTGLSSVHVCRTLRRFARKGIIETSDHLDVRIIDLDALSDAAEIDVEKLEAEILPTSVLDEAVA